MFEIVNGRPTDDGRTPEHGYTISSPCEPEGSGELKTYEREGIPKLLVYKENSTEILIKLIAKGFQASSISTYDFLRFLERYRTI